MNTAGSVRIFISTADTARLLGVDERRVADLIDDNLLSWVLTQDNEWLVDTASVIEYARTKDIR